MTTREVLSLVRPHLLDLQPYSSARDEFDQGSGEKGFAYLDANENPFNNGYNRYPDPHQGDLKRRISQLKGVDVKNIFLGNGSDEAIDLIIRLFCESGDSILIPSPTYGMYKVSADIHNVKVKTILLNEDFQFDDVPTEESARVFFLCSPNNPSGNLIKRDTIATILSTFKGIVVVDEAYIDFTENHSWLRELDRYPNLVVLQTLSKAWGLAGLRIGMAFAGQEIIALLNKIKPPYNISGVTQKLAESALEKPESMRDAVALIIQERQRLAQELAKLPNVKKVFPSDANFLLVRIDNARQMYDQLINQHIVVRDRSRVVRCDDCLRITVGTNDENNRLLEALRNPR